MGVGWFFAGVEFRIQVPGWLFDNRGYGLDDSHTKTILEKPGCTCRGGNCYRIGAGYWCRLVVLWRVCIVALEVLRIQYIEWHCRALRNLALVLLPAKDI